MATLNLCKCGGVPQVVYRVQGTMEFWVECSECGRRTQAFVRLSAAVKAWNLLTRGLSLAELSAEQEKALDRLFAEDAEEHEPCEGGSRCWND